MNGIDDVIAAERTDAVKEYKIIVLAKLQSICDKCAGVSCEIGTAGGSESFAKLWESILALKHELND